MENLEKNQLVDESQPVPYIVHEGSMARMERSNKRLLAVVILLIVLLVGSNIGWIVYEAQVEDMTVTQDIDTGEGDTIVAGVGDVNYGQSQTDGKSQTP